MLKKKYNDNNSSQHANLMEMQVTDVRNHYHSGAFLTIHQNVSQM